MTERKKRFSTEHKEHHYYLHCFNQKVVYMACFFRVSAILHTTSTVTIIVIDDVVCYTVKTCIEPTNLANTKKYRTDSHHTFVDILNPLSTMYVYIMRPQMYSLSLADNFSTI